ncbi:MAG TPA: lysylphosphatidylglycerol synthase transmembrane domain-containing protein [Kofleriaceae bacterium]|jgi:hypothetical protein|nr:lysylphosphatidylglycerol synthase transmembrane domain-containing protein [Kofleriaceae bacterium]
MAHAAQSRLGLALRLIVIAIIVVVVIALAYRLDWRRLGEVFSRARAWPLVLAAALHFAALWAKAMCWRVMLAPRHRVPVTRLFRYTIAAYAGSAVAPVRAGEALRLWALKTRDGVPLADSAAAALCEKVFDGAAMFALALPLPWLLPDLPRSLRLTMAIGPVAIAAVIAALAIVASRAGVDGWLARFARGMHVLRSPRRAAAAFGALVAAWAIDLTMVELVLYAVGVPLPPPTAFVVLLAINLAIAVPTTPAQVGMHEAGAIAGLSLFDIPAEPAVAFALLYHALQILPLIAVGLALEWRLISRFAHGRDRRVDCTAPLTVVDAVEHVAR